MNIVGDAAYHVTAVSYGRKCFTVLASPGVTITHFWWSKKA